MRKVEAYIQPFMLTKVLRELRDVHVHGLTVSEVKGFGREKDESYPHHEGDYAVDFTPKLKLEMLCRDEDVDALVGAVQRGAHTGRRGDGKVFVMALELVASIRTGQTGDEAI
jgi:nitrogen regulatory protein P-II 1